MTDIKTDDLCLTNEEILHILAALNEAIHEGGEDPELLDPIKRKLRDVFVARAPGELWRIPLPKRKIDQLNDRARGEA